MGLCWTPLQLSVNLLVQMEATVSFQATVVAQAIGQEPGVKKV